MRRVLVTGGAGFIGSHVADELLRHAYRVRVLDSLHSQVHGDAAVPPDYLDARVELLVGDVRDRRRLRTALEGVDAVIHLAARVGVGQSMYEIEPYTSANTLGTAVLLEELVSSGVKRLVVASSMSVFGEGAYETRDGRPAQSIARTEARMSRGEWELLSDAGEELVPIPTPETKVPSLASVYALSKFDQERLCLLDWRTGDQKYYVSDTRQFQKASGWHPRVGLREGLARLMDWLGSNGIPETARRAG